MNFGCSSFSWKTKDGRHLLGRTYDQLGDLRANRVICVPKGSPCLPGLQPAGREVTAHYGYTGMAVLGYGEPILVDGVNEAGLMGALLHYPEYAIYPPKPRPDQMAVHPGRLLAYLFGLCSGVEEVAALLPTVALVDDLSLGSPLPAHYIFSDRSGEAAVLEPDAGGLKLHRHTIGVLTNSPDYLWHRTNLRTYVGTTNLPKRLIPSQGMRFAPSESG